MQQQNAKLFSCENICWFAFAFLNLDFKPLKTHLFYTYSNTHALNKKYCTKLKFRLWNSSICLFVFLFWYTFW